MRLYRVPKGTGKRPATPKDGMLPRLRFNEYPGSHPWKDYDVVEIPDGLPVPKGPS